MRKQLLAAMLLLFLCWPVFGQEISVPAVEISGGYTMLRDDDLSKHSHGWASSVGFNYDRWTGFLAEVSGNYGTATVSGSNVDFRMHSLMGGPQASFRNSSRVTPFLQLLIGGVRRNITALGRTHTMDAAMQAGGGADFWMRPKLGVRVTGLYRHILADQRGNNAPTNGFRFQAGVVMALGSR